MDINIHNVSTIKRKSHNENNEIGKYKVTKIFITQKDNTKIEITCFGEIE